LSKHLKFNVDKDNEGLRIDKFLATVLGADFSRTEIKKIIDQKKVLLNSHAVKPNHKVQEADIIEIEASRIKQDTDKIPPADIPLDIIFEDDYIIVINKPAGLVVHPGAGHLDDTLVNALMFYTKNLSDCNGPEKLGIVHRLDKDTSGVMVVARDNKTHRFLADQFKDHTISKVYLALVHGSIEHDEGQIDAPISRSAFNRKKMSTSGGSPRHALSRYKVITRNKQFTVVEVYPKTGRTHQIRVHMAHLGHPILGDDAYDRTNIRCAITRQALHAKRVEFLHPKTHRKRVFEASVPADMQKIIDSKELM